MQSDIDTLRQLNIELGEAENQGDREWLHGVMAPELAFRRADETFDNRAAFLAMVKPGGSRETEVESVETYGDRAVVKCIVTVKSESGEKRFHNLRLFVRDNGRWKLLGWANESL
jgi:hypothetical protein